MEYREQVTVKTQGGTVSAKQIVIASGLPISSFKELHGIFKAKVTHALTAKYDDGAPISADLFWDTNDPYFYFRRLDASTVILGGEDSYVGTKPTREPHTALSNFLRKHFDGKFTVTNRWSGSLYDSEDGLPYASAHPHYEDRVFIGSCAGFGGNGLVFGTLAASVISDLIVGKENKFSPLLSFSRTSAKIPEPAQKGKGEDTARIFVKVANTGQVQEGELFCAEANGNKVALFKSGSEFYALSNTCTHAGGSLCEGTLEGKIVQCPLHGAKFDFTDGSLKGPPARKSVESFKTRVVQDSIEVEVGASRVEKEAGMLSTPTVPKKKEVRLFAGARKNPKYVLSASALALAFWLLQFADQYLFLIPGEFEGSIVRSFALSGATLISLALIIGPLRTLTKYNLLAHRRTVGVWGFTFIIMHFITVSVFLFESDLSRLFWDSNPVANPLLFSVGAFPIFVAMWATSTDWAVEKLSFKRWKFLHRLVFLAYIAAVAHYSLINPELLLNPSGYLLISFTVAAFSLELAAFVKTVRRKGFGKGGAIGLLIILFGASVFTAAFGFREEVVGGVEPNPDLPLSMAMVRMTDFMEQQGGNQSVMTEPIEEDMA
ncbi:MAG: FAD-dependent oxidoreductase, partial [Nitrososphaerales archaeon]